MMIFNRKKHPRTPTPVNNGDMAALDTLRLIPRDTLPTHQEGRTVYHKGRAYLCKAHGYVPLLDGEDLAALELDMQALQSQILDLKQRLQKHEGEEHGA